MQSGSKETASLAAHDQLRYTVKKIVLVQLNTAQ